MAYRFFANGRFGEDAILSGSLAATAARCAACDGPQLVVQDTTELVYKWASLTALARSAVRRPGTAPARTLAGCLGKLARLGGYLARTRDLPPGNTVMWRGWSRLADIMLGVELATQRCG